MAFVLKLPSSICVKGLKRWSTVQRVGNLIYSGREGVWGRNDTLKQNERASPAAKGGEVHEGTAFSDRRADFDDKCCWHSPPACCNLPVSSPAGVP
jgi:hypothetical protein